MFANRTGSVPFADYPTRRVGTDIGCVGQLFVGHIEFNASRDFLAYAGGVSQKDMGKPLPCTLGSQGGVGANIPREIIDAGVECIYHKPREPSGEGANG